MAVAYTAFYKMASGGMADVYAGLKQSRSGFERICAIKMLREDLSSDPQFLEMFRDEAKICETLHHANVVQVLDFAEVDNSHAIIMEFVVGVTVSKIISCLHEAEINIPLPAVLLIGREIAKGLQYVHSRKNPRTGKNLGIIHRDVTPSNILISADGEVKIADFGVAKADNNSHKTQVGVVKGKYAYMSPEQFNGEKVDERTDIYGLGRILWEMIAGQKMFRANSETHLIRLISAGPPQEHLRKFNPDCDDQLNAIVMKALSEHPNDRFNSAGELADVLAEYATTRFGPTPTGYLSEFLERFVPDELEEAKRVARTVYEIAEEESSKLSVIPAKDVPDIKYDGDESTESTEVSHPKTLQKAAGDGISYSSHTAVPFEQDINEIQSLPVQAPVQPAVEAQLAQSQQNLKINIEPATRTNINYVHRGVDLDLNGQQVQSNSNDRYAQVEKGKQKNRPIRNFVSRMAKKRANLKPQSEKRRLLFRKRQGKKDSKLLSTFTAILFIAVGLSILKMVFGLDILSMFIAVVTS